MFQVAQDEGQVWLRWRVAKAAMDSREKGGTDAGE